MVFSNSLRLVREDIHAILFVLLGFCSANSATENVFVLLFREVDIIVSVGL